MSTHKLKRPQHSFFYMENSQKIFFQLSPNIHLTCSSGFMEKIPKYLGQPQKYFCFPLPDPVPVWVGWSEINYF